MLEIIKIFPRGFCAGVDRAIQIVERALEKFGHPVYVHHDIVHNTTVVSQLEAKGIIFTEDIAAVPEGAPVIFSAHGVPTCVVEKAQERQLFVIDATCPLVSKVHAQVRHFFVQGIKMVLIGHEGHPEVVGTLGQVPEGWVMLVQTHEDIKKIPRCFEGEALGCVTQTTLSWEETQTLISALRVRFPHLILPSKQDICYATTNRQEAVKLIAPSCDILFVVGSQHSSNSRRLVEVAQSSGCLHSFLIDTPADIPWSFLEGKKCLGLTSGASAPEHLMDAVVAAICAQLPVSHVHEKRLRDESVTFNLPHLLK